MASLTDIGRAALAKAVLDKSATLFLAWGEGDVAWDTVPISFPSSITGLVAEIGRAPCLAAMFVTPDEAGEIITASGNFAVSVDPTTYLYLRADFGYTAAPTATIREYGLFIDCELEPGLPPGQTYFLPSEIAAPGLLLAAETCTAIARSPATQHSFKFVMPF